MDRVTWRAKLARVWAREKEGIHNLCDSGSCSSEGRGAVRGDLLSERAKERDTGRQTENLHFVRSALQIARWMGGSLTK